MFNASPVFYENYKSKSKVVVNQGGTASSKTYSIIQVLYLRAIENAGQIITVVGESIPNLKKGAYRDAETIYNETPALKKYVLSWNKTDRIIYFKNGSLIEFASFEDHQSAKNGKRDYLFVNEANGVQWLIYWQLAIRTRKQIFVDYNPSSPFWCHDELIGKDGVELIISDHRHNPFLSEDDHAKIETINDPELWRVYARGLTGNITGLIFPNWTRIPDSEMPTDEDFVGGLDYGMNDPTCGMKVWLKDDKVYLHELFYQPGLSAERIKMGFWDNGFSEENIIYCDHNYPDLTSELRTMGVYVLEARKGPGSIIAGIIKLKELKVFYSESSENLHEERKRYEWMKDPKTGKSMNKPIDAFNHAMDASRYAAYSNSFTKDRQQLYQRITTF